MTDVDVYTDELELSINMCITTTTHLVQQHMKPWVTITSLPVNISVQEMTPFCPQETQIM